METKKSKYDTNPLDPDVERQAEEAWGDGGAPTQQVGGATREVGNPPNENARQNVYSEAPTRRYDNPPLETPYPSVFVPPTYAPPSQYKQQANNNPYQQNVYNPPQSHSVAGLGVGERWATMMAYAPYIGVVVSLIELLLTPRRETRVRFHASQALALHIAIIVIETILGGIGNLTNSGAGSALFRTAAFIFLVISMIRTWRGEAHRIAPLTEPAQWFNQHIEPRNQN